MSFSRDADVDRNPVDVDYVTRIASFAFPLMFLLLATSRKDARVLLPSLDSARPLTSRLPTAAVPRRRSSTDAFTIYENFACTFDSTLYTTAAVLYGCNIPSTKRRRREHTSPPLSPRRFLFCSPFPFFLFLFSTSFSLWRVPRFQRYFE